jgi:uncharacterized membrane protein
LISTSIIFSRALIFLTDISERKQQLRVPDERRPLHRRKICIAIISCFVLNALADFAAYTLAPLSLVAPFGANVILFNVLLAYFVFSERLYWQDALGSLCILGGCAGAIVSGSRAVNVTTLDAFVTQWIGIYFWIFFGLQLLSLILVSILVRWVSQFEVIEHAADVQLPPIDAIQGVNAAGSIVVLNEQEMMDQHVDNDHPVDGLNAKQGSPLELQKQVSFPENVLKTDHLPQIHSQAEILKSDRVSQRHQIDEDVISIDSVALVSPRVAHVTVAFCYAWWAATMSTWLNLFGKGMAQLFTLMVSGDRVNVFVTVWPYICIFGILLCAVGSVRILQLLVRKHEAMLAIPLYQCMFMIQLILLGWVFFGEFATLSALDVGMFVFSISVCVIGVAFVAQRPMPEMIRPVLDPLPLEEENVNRNLDMNPLEHGLDAKATNIMTLNLAIPSNVEFSSRFHHEHQRSVDEYSFVQASQLSRFKVRMLPTTNAPSIQPIIASDSSSTQSNCAQPSKQPCLIHELQHHRLGDMSQDTFDWKELVSTKSTCRVRQIRVFVRFRKCDS